MVKGRNQPLTEIRALKQFSQNFLRDEFILQKMQHIIHENLKLNESTRLLEIGPGTGALTRKIAEIAPEVSILALEKDKRAVHFLNENVVPQFLNLKVLEGNILDCKASELGFSEEQATSTNALCVGNLPYAISSDFLLWFCKNKNSFRGGHFLLQKEVVDRISAKVGTKAYGRITAFLQLHFTTTVHFDVLPEAFEPRPKVTSTFFTLTPKSFHFENDEFQEIFEKCTAFLFSSRRKMLRKTLEHLFTSWNIPYAQCEPILLNLLQRHGASLTDRPESLGPICLYEIALMLRPKPD